MSNQLAKARCLREFAPARRPAPFGMRGVFEMRLSAWIAILFMAFAGLASPCHAQATRTWVSGVGDDANPCSRTAPCKTFAGAISKTAAAGEINCLDPGGFGALTITKSISIICDGLEGGVLVSGTNGLVVSAATADSVYLSGLDLEGLGPTAASLNGLKIISAAKVHIVNSTIRGFNSTNGSDGNGILVNNTGATNVFISNVRIDSNQVGVEVRPQSGASASVVIERSFADGGLTGMRGNGISGGTIDIGIKDSMAAGNAGAGFNMTSGSSPSARMMLNQVLAERNNFGVRADGAAASIYVGASTFAANPGADLSINNGGIITSFGTNQVDDGSTVPTMPTR